MEPEYKIECMRGTETKTVYKDSLPEVWEAVKWLTLDGWKVTVYGPPDPTSCVVEMPNESTPSTLTTN